MSNTLVLQQRQAFLEHARDLKNRLLQPIEEEQAVFERTYIQTVAEKHAIPALVKDLNTAWNDIHAAEKALAFNRDRKDTILGKIQALGFSIGENDKISFRYGGEGSKLSAAMEKAVSQKFEPKWRPIKDKHEAVCIGIWAANTGDQAKELVLSLLK